MSGMYERMAWGAIEDLAPQRRCQPPGVGRMTCASCHFWDRHPESDISKKFGDCRFNSPLISIERRSG
jgi:hypothetical protein